MDYTKNAGNFKTSHCSKKDGLPIVGILLIGLGLVFLLDRLGLFSHEVRSILISIPSLLIFIGIVNVFKSHSRVPGLILLLVGSVLLLPRIIDIPFETRQLIWPMVIIAIGIIIIFKGRGLKTHRLFKGDTHSTNSEEVIDEVAIFGGGKRVISSQNLRGGNVNAIFGGLEIDLTEAELSNDTAVLDVNCIFGGVTLIVKPEWDVQVQVTSILGGFDDKRKIYSREGVNAPRKRLIIKGAAIFGGGEVKSF